jgi:hypothetical protein
MNTKAEVMSRAEKMAVNALFRPEIEAIQFRRNPP